MNRGVEVRQTFINSAIRVVSVQGIQNATTKALSLDSGLSEVYIYRYFKSKEDLLKETFDSLDKELMYLMKKSISDIYKTENQSVEMGFKALFHDFWKFALGDRDKCSFFIQYYYSSYYSKHSDEERRAIYQPLLDIISSGFVEGADAWIELNHMYDIAFSKLWRVIRGTMPDGDETEKSVYREVEMNEKTKILWNKII